MKRAYRPIKKTRTADLARVGGLLAIVAGVAVLAVAGFLLFGNPATASGPSANFTPEAKGAPRFKADKSKIDLGHIRLGQTVQAAFEITNTGDQPLRFTADPFIEVVEGC